MHHLLTCTFCLWLTLVIHFCSLFLCLAESKLKLIQLQHMTSPKKSLQLQKESTLFGDLSHLEKQTARLSAQLLEDIESLKKVQDQLPVIEKQAKGAADQFKIKAHADIAIFEDKIKSFLIAQKAEYSRFATQINQMVGTHKEINSQLKLLQNRFSEYKRNVGL